MIRVDDLTFAYTGAEKPAVRNLSFAIETGEVFGFLGPSGAGKSTTQKILIGLLREFSGSVSMSISAQTRTRQEKLKQPNAGKIAINPPRSFE